MDQPHNLVSILSAIIFAAQKHHGHLRKDGQGSPYIIHPLTVAKLIVSIGGVDEPTILIAAILHDTLEDTPTKPVEINQQFGEEALNLVLEVTDDKSLPKDCRKQMQILHAPSLSYRAKIIKLADKLANCRDVLYSPPHNWSHKRCQEYIQWASDVVTQFQGTNVGLEAAFNVLLVEAENKFNFQVEPFSTINDRNRSPGAEHNCK